MLSEEVVYLDQMEIQVHLIWLDFDVRFVVEED